MENDEVSGQRGQRAELALAPSDLFLLGFAAGPREGRPKEQSSPCRPRDLFYQKNWKNQPETRDFTMTRTIYQTKKYE